jgi:hypothetical protein
MWGCYNSRGGPGDHCRYPTDRVPPHIGLSLRQGARRTAMYPTAPDLASLLGRAPMLPHAPRLRIPPPVREGSGAAMCLVALDPVSLLGKAPMLPCAPWIRTAPPCSGEFWCCHVPHGSGLHLPAQRALALPRAPRLRTPPPCSRGLQRCHVPRGSGSRFPIREGSGTATCPVAPDPTSLIGRAPALPYVPQLSAGHEPQE